MEIEFKALSIVDCVDSNVLSCGDFQEANPREYIVSRESTVNNIVLVRSPLKIDNTVNGYGLLDPFVIHQELH